MAALPHRPPLASPSIHRDFTASLILSSTFRFVPLLAPALASSVMAASLNELKEALLHTLAAKGSLGQMKARIRAEIFSALDSADDEAEPKAPLSNTNLLINELVREYLAFNQYRYTLGVFLPEANQPETPPFDRQFISRELHVQENQHSVQMYVQIRAASTGRLSNS